MSAFAKFRSSRTVKFHPGLQPTFRYGGRRYAIRGEFSAQLHGDKVDVYADRFNAPLFVRSEGDDFEIREVMP